MLRLLPLIALIRHAMLMFRFTACRYCHAAAVATLRRCYMPLRCYMPPRCKDISPRHWLMLLRQPRVFDAGVAAALCCFHAIFALHSAAAFAAYDAYFLRYHAAAAADTAPYVTSGYAAKRPRVPLRFRRYFEAARRYMP